MIKVASYMIKNYLFSAGKRIHACFWTDESNSFKIFNQSRKWFCAGGKRGAL